MDKRRRSSPISGEGGSGLRRGEDFFDVRQTSAAQRQLA